MTKIFRLRLGATFFIAAPLCALLVTGCNNAGEGTGGNPGPPPPGQIGSSAGGGGPMGGPGGGRMGGDRGAPIDEKASGAEIYQAKCGCHGPNGQGGRAPVLTAVGSKSDADLYAIIHDGRQKMPSFGSQLSEAQIKKVVAYLKTLKP